ncbi:MAG: transposase [Myxococcota bacterium]
MPKRKKKTTEVIARPENDRRQRRHFSAEDKARILKEADACKRGELGALLRREGIYSSHLSTWRQQLERRGLEGLAPAKPGRKPTRDAKDRRIEELEKRAAKLEKELRISKALIEMQGKAHEILGIALPRIEESEDDSWSSSDSARKKSR